MSEVSTPYSLRLPLLSAARHPKMAVRTASFPAIRRHCLAKLLTAASANAPENPFSLHSFILQSHCSARRISACMQHLHRQLLSRLLSHRPATGSSFSSKVLVSSQAVQSPQPCQSSLQSAVEPSAVRLNYARSDSPCLRKHKPHTRSSSHGFATKAEEYDLIVAEAGLVRIEGYDDTGFIVNDVQVQGSVFCIGDLTTVWKVTSWKELTPESLSMLQLYKPAPDLVILGCGLHSQMVPPALQSYFKQHNIAYEAIDTANAVSTFNILNQEGRKVAGCLLPAGAT